MADTELNALPAVASGALDADDVFYTEQDGISKKVTTAVLMEQVPTDQTLTDHLDELDPTVHNADKIASASTVAQGNVEDDLSTLDAEKADAAATTEIFTAITDQIGGMTIGAVVGNPASRVIYQDDFRWSYDATTSGAIGETFNRRTGGTSAVGTNDIYRPGNILLSTGTTINTYTALYANAGGFFKMDQYFDFHCWFKPVTVDANVLHRVGISSDPTSETPTDAVFIEKLGADTAFWRNVTRIASTEDRNTAALGPALTSNAWAHVRIRRLSATTVGISTASSTFGVAGAMSPELTVTYSPAVFGIPFVAVKNATTTTKQLAIDRWQLQLWDLVR